MISWSSLSVLVLISEPWTKSALEIKKPRVQRSHDLFPFLAGAFCETCYPFALYLNQNSAVLTSCQHTHRHKHTHKHTHTHSCHKILLMRIMVWRREITFLNQGYVYHKLIIYKRAICTWNHSLILLEILTLQGNSRGIF